MAYDMYQEIILQHYRSPKNFGPIPEPDLTGEESNPLCGDHIRIDLRLDPARQRIETVHFSGEGCAISVASASMLTERLAGRTLDEASQLRREDVLAMIAIPLSPVRVKCALTGFMAFGRAMQGASLASTTRPVDVREGPAPT